MDDGEGGLSFDFEGGLDVGPTHPTASNPAIQPAEATGIATTGAAVNSNHHHHQGSLPPVAAAVADGGMGAANHQRRSFRQTVCRHWLRSLCMKGDACGFLHQYDKSRMPICRFFRQYGECREQDCVYKHTNEDIKECNMYKLGFCPNGPDCRYRHAKLPGPPPPVEEVLQKIQQLTTFNYGNSNRYFQNRNPNFSQQPEKSQVTQGINAMNQAVKPHNGELPTGQQPQSLPSQEHLTQVQMQSMSNGQQNQGIRIATTLPQGTSRYFIVKSCNRENLELSVQQGVWATQRSNEAKLNEAFESVDNVILIFSINRTRHFQGCAKMTSRIGGSVSGGNWKHAHGTGHYGRNFSVKWLKLCELSFHKTRHLRNPYNENLPVKISRDCQEMESSVGEQLASLLYLEPDSELMAVCVAAESKREEERAKGISEIRTEDPDIVPFEDNEEEDEEESDEEEESFGQVYESAGQGRGRGRGMMWPPFMPMARGARPHHGMRGFPPGLMGGDGYPYGAVGPDGFPLPDPFSMAPRPFGPYGPRFSGDFMGPGMMFPGQPGNFSGGGYGMMMGPGRNPFMGRPNRPAGMTPLLPPASLQPAQNSNRTRRDQVRGQDMAGPDTDTRYQQRGKPQREDGNDDSESEDEAPRRSRHGEGKKKKRSLEGDTTNADTQLP